MYEKNKVSIADYLVMKLNGYSFTDPIYEEGFIDGYNTCMRITTEVEPTETQWEWDVAELYKCGSCHEEIGIEYEDDISRYKYCPFCGAKMK